MARDAIGTDSYADFKKSDIGDIFGLEGFALRTRTGEISIHAEKMTLLSKSLQILPEKFHGLTDTDTRYRQRYVDLIMNQDSRIKKVIFNVFKDDDLRSFLDENGGEDIEIIAKIENRSGVDHVEEICEKANGIMIARGEISWTQTRSMWQLQDV